MEEAKARIKGVLCSSGALVTRFNGRDPSLLRGIFPMLHADGIEFMIYPSWDDRLDTVRETMRSMLKDGIFNIPVVHADKRIGELLSHGSESDIAEARRRFSMNCIIAEELNASLMVLHLWGGIDSDYHISRNTDELASFMSEAERHGLLLTVENVICGDKTPLAHMQSILESIPNAMFTIDTKMAEFHLELSKTIECKKLWDGHVRHLHINDYSGGLKDFSDLRVRHIGDGHVDFKPFFEHVLSSGYDGYATVESTSVLPDGSIDIQSINRSLDAVRSGLSHIQ